MTSPQPWTDTPTPTPRADYDRVMGQVHKGTPLAEYLQALAQTVAPVDDVNACAYRDQGCPVCAQEAGTTHDNDAPD